MPISLHFGEPCFVCGKIFNNTDDVVVCPECGTPYHRHCWDAVGTCQNTNLHESGESWDSQYIVTLDPPKICPNCGTQNHHVDLTCKNCGASLGDNLLRPSWESTPQEEPPEPSEDASLRERIRYTTEQIEKQEQQALQDRAVTFDGESAADVMAFVKKNTSYYMPKFVRFHEGHRFSLNFPCIFFPQFFFANRKMWGMAILTTLVVVLLGIPQDVTVLGDYLTSFAEIAGESDPNLVHVLETMSANLERYSDFFYHASLVCQWLELCLYVLCGLFGNYLYYRFVLRKVRKTRETVPESGTRQNVLRMKGGTNGWLILAMVGLTYVLTVMLVFVIMLLLQC